MNDETNRAAEPLGPAERAVESPPAQTSPIQLAPGATEHMYMPAESLFGGVCNKVRARGWTVLPQSRQGKRLTSRIDGEALKWGEFIKRMPTPEETRRWGVQARAENAAVLLGPSSGNVWAVDIDVLDLELSYAIQELALEILGATPYRRTGMAPKIALFYRAETEDDLPPYRSIKFMDAEGKQPTDDGIEILGAGRMITCYGYHHKTSEYFRWYANQPLSNGPQDVPVATLEQLEAFFDAVQDLRHAYRHGAAGAAAGWVDGSADAIVVGKVNFGDRPVAWVQNSEGKIVEGRDEYLWTLTKDTVKRHAAAIVDGTIKIEDLRTAIRDAFRAVEFQDKKAWTEADLRRAIVDKAGRAVEMLKEGRIKPRLPKGKPVAANADGKIVAEVHDEEYPYVTPQKHAQEDDTFAFLTSRRETMRIKETRPDPVKAAERRINPDRAAEGEKAAAGVAKGVNAFLDDVEKGLPNIHIIDGPTGVGKTATFITELVKRKPLLSLREREDDPGPFIMLVPTYQNVGELRAKSDMTGLDPSLSDDDLIAAATELGLVKEDKINQALSELRRLASDSGLLTMSYMGKIRAGCLEAEKISLLQKARIPTGQMCRTKVIPRDVYGRPTGGQKEEFYCPHYSTCPAIQQRKEIEKVHLVFMVRSFLTLALPEEAENPKGLVIDEQIFDALVSTTTMPTSTLERPRRAPALTKKEREMEMDPHELLQSRSQAAELAVKWLREGEDLAARFHAWSETRIVDGKVKTFRGIDIVHDARRVCGNAMTSQAELHPDLTLAQIEQICTKPTGTNIQKEYRFWALVSEGIEEHVKAELAGRPIPPKDIRIQLQDYDPDAKVDQSDIRLSWKIQGNWSGVPTLLLDASIDEQIIRRAMGLPLTDEPETGGDEDEGEEKAPKPKVIVHKIEVSLNERVAVAINRRLSSSALNPPKDADDIELAKAAQTIADMRLQISTLAAVKAHGRVVVFPTKYLRRLIQWGWTKPRNVDFGHHGATAGLDYAKHHVGNLNLSRIEIPVREVDGLKAALMHGEDNPEPLIDSTGTGCHEDGSPNLPHMEKRTLKIRDGSDLSYDCQRHSGELAHAIQAQYREEQLRQDKGRLRTVFRETPGCVVIVAECIPEDIVVDEVIAFEDLATRSGGLLWDAVRLSNGMVEANILAACAPHIGDVATFKALLDKWFFGVPSTMAKYHKSMVTLSTGEQREVYAPAHDPHWFQTLQDTLGVLRWSGSVEVVEESKEATFASGTAPMDDIETHLAQFDHEAAELQALYDLQQKAIAKKLWRKTPKSIGAKAGFTSPTVPQEYAIGEGVLARKPLRMDVWLMLQNMKNHWCRTGEVEEPTAAVENDDDRMFG